MSAEETYTAVEAALRNSDVPGAERVLLTQWPNQAQMPGDALHLLATVRFQQNRPKEAAELMRAAVAAEPGALRHYIALGHLLSGQQDHAGAAAAFGEALKIDMNWPGLVYVYALSCFRCGNYKEAELAARQMLATAPTPEGWDTLSCALRAQDKAADAIVAAHEGLKLAPESAPLQHSRGAALLKAGRAQEALDVFDRLQALGVQAPAIWLNRGAALASLKRQGEAVAAYAEGARRWPNDKDLQKALTAARG